MNFYLKYFILIILINLFIDFLGYGQKKVELERIRKEKILEIEKIENIINETKQDKDLSLNKINLISKKIDIRNEIIENLTLSVEDIEKRINILNEEINNRSYEIKDLKRQYAKIICTSYYRLKNYNLVMFILSSNNFNQAYRRLYFLRQYSNGRKNLISKISFEIDIYGEKILCLKDDKVKKEILLNSKENEKENLRKDKNNLNKLIETYTIKENNLKNELKELQECTKKIEYEIEKVIKEEALKKIKRNKNTTSEDLLLTKNFADNKGNIPWPVNDGTVISLFGEHQHPVFKGIIIKNNGIDISTRCNSIVYCVFNGIVSKIFAIKGANFAIIIRHGDFLTVYQNLQKVSVKIGEEVTTKKVIGYSFCDNINNISNVHFELWQELNKMDPIELAK